MPDQEGVKTMLWYVRVVIDFSSQHFWHFFDEYQVIPWRKILCVKMLAVVNFAFHQMVVVKVCLMHCSFFFEVKWDIDLFVLFFFYKWYTHHDEWHFLTFDKVSIENWVIHKELDDLSDIVTWETTL